MKGPIFRRAWFNIFSIVLLCGVSFAGGIWVRAASESRETRLLKAAFENISSESFYSELSSRELAYVAVRSMLGEIQDPYAELIEPAAAQNFQATFSGKTGVVGLYAENRSGRIVIAIVFPGGPADAAGLQPGDVILGIDDIRLDSAADSSETGLLLRGAPGSQVRVSVERAGKQLDFTLERKEREFVTARMLPSGYGYISLTAYNRTASQQMRQQLETLLAGKPSGLIWDLRNNEGGDMQAAQEILSYFIDDGVLFTAELTRGRRVEFRAKGNAFAADIPLVVLIDHTSYSAAETCAAAVAERGRGATIGATTYGKGVIQATIPLVDSTLLQMTVAKWLSPAGEWYDGRGVPPMIEFSDDPATDADELLERAVDYLAGQ